MKLPNLFFKSNKIRLSDSETLFILDSLAQMLSSGIPILEALNSIEEDTTSKNTKKLVVTISESLGQGKTLAESFGQFPESFDKVFISLVKSGEASGNLDNVLKNASLTLKGSIETKGNIKSALFYPGIILGVLVLVGFLVFGYSLPKVAKVFFDLKIKLPDYSNVILHLSLWFGDNNLYVILFLVIVVFLGYLLLKIGKVKRATFTLIFKLPIIANIVKLKDLASFTHTTGLLLGAGVPIIEALEISKGVVSSARLRTDIERIIEELTKGQSLAKSMKIVSKSFPSLLRRVVAVGEESGKLDSALTDISKYYSEKFSQIIKNLTVIIEPILIIFIAALVALVLISVVLPIYQGIGSINRH